MIDYAPRSNRELDYNQAFLYALTLSHNKHKDWRFLTIQEYYSNPLMPVNTWHDSVPLDNSRYAMPVRTIC